MEKKTVKIWRQALRDEQCYRLDSETTKMDIHEHGEFYRLLRAENRWKSIKERLGNRNRRH